MVTPLANAPGTSGWGRRPFRHPRRPSLGSTTGLGQKFQEFQANRTLKRTRQSEKTSLHRDHVKRGLPADRTGALTAIQRANSDSRLNLPFHSLFLDGFFETDVDGKGRIRR
jgi:hypothetical protein